MKRRAQRIEHFKAHPIEVQYQVFHELIDAAKGTDWGRKYQYDSIQTIKQYQERVPISTYEDLYPYIERVLKGQQNVLWPSDVEWFSKSSGTTNARSKYLPITPESLEDCHYRGGRDVMTLYVQNCPDSLVFEGKGLSIGGSLHTNPFDDEGGMVGDVSAVIMRNLPAWADYLRTPPIEVALLDNWEEKLARMTEICGKENVTSILGVPTWTIVLLDHIMQAQNAQNMLEVWPDFEVFIHGAVAFDPYRELFKQKYFPSDRVKYMETYNASEGFFALQDDLSNPGEMLLMLDYGIFYEFIPTEEWGKEYPKALTLDEVELDRNYALVISTNSGLWRYQIGDTIRFTSKYPFRIKISGRTKHFINAFGEEVIVENADAALTYACEQTGAIINDYTAGPVYMADASKGRHEWIVEFCVTPPDWDTFCHLLDTRLREVNSDYDAKRFNDLALLPPLIHQVPTGTFYEWMGKRGKLGGQNKVPRLSNNREYLDGILEMVYQMK
ncbi:MAG: GH3 auxin-responsive promoter family protein [Runella sp.]